MANTISVINNLKGNLKNVFTLAKSYWDYSGWQ